MPYFECALLAMVINDLFYFFLMQNFSGIRRILFLYGSS